MHAIQVIVSKERTIRLRNDRAGANSRFIKDSGEAPNKSVLDGATFGYRADERAYVSR